MRVVVSQSPLSRRVLVVAAALAAAIPFAFVDAASAAVCADYSNQADAQRAKDTRDADGDGKYCEDLPCPCLWPGDDSSAAPTPSHPHKKRTRRHRALSAKAVITHVVDGDTVRVRTSKAGRSKGIRTVETIRLIGIDTPETVKPGTPIECGGIEAKDSMLRMAFGDRAIDADDDGLLDEDGTDGALVTLRTDPSQDRRDRYGRLLAYVTASPSGVDIAKRQLREGWATTYVFEKRFRRYGAYKDASKGARHDRRGVWAHCGGDFHRHA